MVIVFFFSSASVLPGEGGAMTPGGAAAVIYSPRQRELEECTKVRILDKIIDPDTNHGVSEAGMRLADYNEGNGERRAVVGKLGFVWNGEPGLPVLMETEANVKFASFRHCTLRVAVDAAAAARAHPKSPDEHRQTLEQRYRESPFMHTRSTTGAAPARFFVVTMLRKPVSRYESWFYYATRGFAPSINQFYTIREVLDLRARLRLHFNTSQRGKLENHILPRTKC
jgi:hypothetical protein